MRRYFAGEDGYIEKDEWQPEYWINVERPDDADIAFLRGELGVPESFLESATDADERPRFDREGDWRLTIIRIPRKSVDAGDAYSTLPLGVITKEGVLITLCRERAEMLDDFVEHSQKRHTIVGTKPDFILHLVFSATYWYQNYLREISATVADTVKMARRSVANEDLYRFTHLQTSLVWFNTSLRGNTMLVDRLNNMFVDDCDPELLDDVEIELAQAQNTVDVYIEILDSTMDTLASVVSNNVNQIMKRMTSVSIILMLPTLIASFYGMNVAVALGSNPYAFWIIIAFSLALALGIYLILRRTDWL